MKRRLFIERSVTYGKLKVPYVNLVYNVNNFIKRNKKFHQDIEFVQCSRLSKIIVLNPKVASRSIVEVSLKDPDRVIRKNLSNIKNFTGEIILPVREPRARFVSFWNDKILNRHPNYISLLRYKYEWFNENINMEDFLYHLQTTSSETYEKHFCIQADIYRFLSSLERKVSCASINEIIKLTGASGQSKNSSIDNRISETYRLLEASNDLFSNVYSDDIHFYNNISL